MKALSVRQPWAWLIVHGFKPMENRVWRSTPQGRIAIHAARTFDREGYECVQANFPQIKMPEQFDYGGIVGTVEDCGTVEESSSPWFSGPFGHVLRNPRPCRFVRLPGRLMFFEIDDRLIL